MFSAGHGHASACSDLARLCAPATAHGDRSGRLRLQQLPQLPQHGRPALLPVVVVAVVVKGFWAGLMARGSFNGCMVCPDAVRPLRGLQPGLCYQSEGTGAKNERTRGPHGRLIFVQ